MPILLSSSPSPLMWIIIPLVIGQYVLAIFCLLKLLFLGLPKTKFWIWNVFILLVFYIGGITFLLCRYTFKIFPQPKKEPTNEATLEVDPPLNNGEKN